jgi:hypothetical protein
MAPEKHRQRCQLIPIDPEVGSKPWDHNFFGSIFCMTNVLNKMTETMAHVWQLEVSSL